MITAEDFLAATGRSPQDDDLERANCDKIGTPGHFACGWCDQHRGPAWLCACWQKRLK